MEKITETGLELIRKTSFSHGDGFGYDISCYEDGTEIKYFETKDFEKPYSLDNRIEKERTWFTTGFDIEICNEIINLRKLQLEDEKK
jgi:hypothetical protein